MIMKKIIYILSIAALLILSSSCIKEFDPQQKTVTADQAASAPGSFDNFVNAIEVAMCGGFDFGTTGASQPYPYDLKYPGELIMRDMTGQDMVWAGGNDWFSSWYEGHTSMNPRYLVCQIPWTFYYKQIKACNNVIALAGEDPIEEHRNGAGIAYAFRALFYLDLAQSYCQKPYTADPDGMTVPIVTEAVMDYTHNPRASWTDMMTFILGDLDKAEEYLEGYKRENVYFPDQSVVYGLKARAFLLKGEWENAKKYAKLAQSGYSIMTEDQYTSWEDGFNKPNSSWMLGCRYREDDDGILLNDADSSWGSMMFVESLNGDIYPGGSSCGYAGNYGSVKKIDRHLYETIPATDFRKKCYVDFAIDEIADEDEYWAALSKYTNYPRQIYTAVVATKVTDLVGGVELKFRMNGGDDGRKDQHKGFVCSVPMMRVEEMYLIEAEAAGRLNESEGISLLTAFAKTRDASYQYGTHRDSYYNTSSGPFINEVWWQRRVEFWGEGLSMFDIKRLEKGVIRSYKNTNHQPNFRWNIETAPDRMIWPIIETESKYNFDLVNNPYVVKPTSDSPEFVF